MAEIELAHRSDARGHQHMRRAGVGGDRDGGGQGATETVVGESMLTSIDTKEGSAYKRGVQYEVASGDLIPNLGEKRFVGICENGETRNMTAQVCDVNKALLSVKRMVWVKFFHGRSPKKSRG